MKLLQNRSTEKEKKEYIINKFNLKFRSKQANNSVERLDTGKSTRKPSGKFKKAESLSPD